MNKIFFLFLSSPYISFHFIRFRLHFRFHFRFHFKLHHESFHFMFHFMFHIMSHPLFHFDSFHFMSTSGGISRLSPGSDYFISCRRPAASLGSVPGQTISFHVNIRRHLNAQSRVWLFHFFVFDVIHFQSFSVYDSLPNDRRVWTPMPSAEINHSWRRSLYL